VTSAPALFEPTIPHPRGPLSDTVIDLLSEYVPYSHLTRIESSIYDTDPFGLDLHLALYVCYELHYRGFAGVDPRWEWDPALLHLRRRLEDAFLEAVRAQVGELDYQDSVAAELAQLSTEPAGGAGGLTAFLRDKGTWEQMREYFVHRSLYHLKEGDPHAWVIPRITGQAKASFVAVEFDEFGGGRGARLHQQLFADLLRAADLDATYLGYINSIEAPTLAAVNLMSMLGLHRQLRGAAIGHFAATEITSPPGSQRMVDALNRMGAAPQCVAFYAEHVEADAVHEQVVRTDVVGDLIAREPHLAADVVFGIRAFNLVEDRLADHMLTAWQADQSSLRVALS